MTRKDLAFSVREDLSCYSVNLSLGDVDAIIDNAFWHIGHALATGENVSIKNFGSFTVKKHAERISRNPRTGEPITVPAHNAVYFKPFSALKEGVNS